MGDAGGRAENGENARPGSRKSSTRPACPVHEQSDRNARGQSSAGATRAMSAEIGDTWPGANVARLGRQSRQKSAEFGPNLDETGPTSVEVAKLQPKRSRTWGTSHWKSANVGGNCAQVGPRQVESTKFKTSSPKRRPQHSFVFQMSARRSRRRAENPKRSQT